jgi:hypothetical protein
MAAATINGKARRGKKAGLLGAAAATAAVMTVGLSVPAVIPDAKAALDLNAVTTGPLFRIADALGLNSVDITTGVSALDPLTINLAYTNSDPVNLNNKINAFPFGGFTAILATFKRQPGGTLGAAILGGSGQGAYNSALAYEALLSSAGGNPLPGYNSLQGPGLVNSLTGVSCTRPSVTCVQGTNVTNLAVLLVNNPGTPNGGLYARFAPILNLFGIDPVAPEGTSASSTVPDNGGKITLNAATVGLALGYNALSDLPATLNPFSMVNSLLATVLPTYLLGGGKLEGVSLNEIYTKLGFLALAGTPSTSYGTFVFDDLPILEPLRLPSRILNAVFGALNIPIALGTPLADALQPALTILVNTGYTDVQTPSEGGTYNRTYDKSGIYTPYLSEAPLTPAEWAQVPGDVFKALIGGFTDEIKKIFGVTPPAVSSVPASVSASLKSSPATQVNSPTTSSESPDPTPVDPGSTPADVTTPVHDPTVRATKGGTDENSPSRDANKATPHRVRGSASDNAGDGKQANNDSPSRAASARSAKSAA